ncbi:hypothetical protein M409DRAFT_30910 [Zasmidium cellare ATCC 36951]|uniref:SnoaL-like domain-containing protein n=1 Tax=Zasmidium cellare ATCC 36951 TaxID=1080233 RepID=A0A6A6BVL9_ZASCE|nr:uncharacterized protein M409DRAFT_30910 [Zasmidium cellare ATCC 36951]KAF2158583.1 hypothetical protein M409DRAFT_30910 [Zasmidium cellare ATCC 36951]
MVANTDLYERMAETSKAMVLSHVDAFNAQDTSILSRDLVPDTHRRIAPATFEQEFHPTGWSNRQYEESLAPMLGKLHGMKIEINDVIVDTKKMRSTVHSSHIWTVPIEGEVTDWPMEFVWILELSETGDKVLNILEFVDTHYAVTFYQKSRSKHA